jgi:acyl-CoA hydrolase
MTVRIIMTTPHIKEYKEKLQTADEAVKIIKSGENVMYGMFNGKPIACDRALAARKDELKNVHVIGSVTLPPIPEVVTKDPKGDSFAYSDLHFSPLTRIMQAMNDKVYYHPIVFGEGCGYWDFLLSDPEKISMPKGGTLIIRTAPMDKNGYFNFGLHNSCSYGEGLIADNIIVEVNENIPTALGGARESFHVSQISHIVESDNEPLISLPSPEPTDVEVKIAENALKHITDGCTIQLGIGGMPNILGKMISQSDLKNLGGHTEMLVDSYMDMHESGKITNMKKNVDRGKTVYTFALGSQKLYDWVDKNNALASYNVDYGNHPTRLAQIDNLISVNSALQVDLYTQVNAETTGFKQISGNGGMMDFVQGAYWSKGGRSLICVSSTYTKSDGTLVSRIVPSFEEGSIVTIPRQMVHIIVTEYGSFSMKVASTWKRAENIIALAHPDFRDGLIKEAEKRKIWNRTNKIV